ncbi:hypothetical protein [Edaphobacter albus]|uniref:hypothetical protein n=1 Tax=Edaphobacter sp. 4G125 TaxID=2763071 RepID=UPI0016458D96|nr:hypothetical protein [Edaphobacter sp. 4G125]QNI36174.1 hypothetical protein H7846_14460 [Edaphobacter sp. 4G125]
MKIIRLSVFLLAVSFACIARADNARFDLVGPKISVRVTRAGTTLPIAEVPNLRAGDKLWVKADLPASQKNHLLLIVAFLRGTTNEPPDDWFTEIDTWDKKRTREGTTITVPEGAEQAVMFVAPETGGDFKTLRSAVKGKPGLFIRANADLNEASFEQQRIERYLAAMKTVPANDKKAIQDRSGKLATTLALRPNADCFKQPVEQQVTCLTQSSAPVLLDDGHGQTIASAISTGPSSDFINAASATPVAGAGVYSAYVGAVVDLVHLVSTMRTAQFQYIPAIAFPNSETLNLKLNTPPSFINPKSVIVIGLPAIQEAKLPPLRPQNENQVSCLLQPKMALLLEGAPLVFSTSFAHDMTLHLNRTGAQTDLPLKPDAFEGGLVVTKEEQRRSLEEAAKEESAAKDGTKLASSTDLTVTGTVKGYWGFDAFDGPTLTLQQVAGDGWKVVGNSQLMTGKDNHLTLRGEGTACVQQIALTNKNGKDVDVSFKPAEGTSKGAEDAKNPLELAVSLKTVQPGDYSLAIKQYGSGDVSKVPLTAYTSDIRLDAVKLHRGDNVAVLSGEGLENVVSVEIAGQTFMPSGPSNDEKTVQLEAKTGVSPKEGTEATAKLKDGRTMKVKVAAQAARPGLTLISVNATATPQDGALPVTLGAKSDIPLNGRLTFVVQTKDAFPRNQTIEVATADGALKTTLSLKENNLVLQDARTAIGMLVPAKAFGQSGFGKLQMRPVAADGTTGDWTPLGTLVRTPDVTAIQCTTEDAPTCTLEGNSLFLAQTFGADKDFAKTAEVPIGFADGTFAVPTPADGRTLYVKLRDDPANAATVVLPKPVAPAPPPPPATAPVAAPAPASDGTRTPQPAPTVPPPSGENTTTTPNPQGGQTTPPQN